MNFLDKRELGRTGLKVGRLGISSSFGAPSKAFEEAFEHGCNYFTWGTFIKGRSKEMKTAIQNIIRNHGRENIVLAIYNYTHTFFFTKSHILKRLKEIGTDYADILLLGYYSQKPSKRILDAAQELKNQKIIRHIGISGHNRKLFKELMRDDIIDVFHLRYNAVNRGAEQDVFPYIPENNKPGIVSFTATKWRQLLDPAKMPPNQAPLKAEDCYRFVLSNNNVDVCMMGAKNLQEMRENLNTLEKGALSEDELLKIREIGDYIYGKPRR